MDRDSALQEVKKMEPDFLMPAKKTVNGHQTYICPICGNGSGDNGDGIAFINGHRKCFHCGFYGDTVDLWKISQGIDSFPEALNSLCVHFGIPIDDNVRTDLEKFKHPHYSPQNSMTSVKPTVQKKKDFMSYFKFCMAKIGETDYLYNRGLSDKIIKDFMLGYQPHYYATNADTGERELWQAIIIPTGKSSYVARNTDLNATKGNRIRKAGGSGLYRKRALAEAKKPIFIVEGELDALSIIEAGGEAVGLGSIANKPALVKILNEHKPSQVLILALDNDKDGQRTSDELEIDLHGMDIPYIRTNVYGTNKDANEALVADREGFKIKIKEAERKCQMYYTWGRQTTMK